MSKNERCQYCNSENIKICDDDEQSIVFYCNSCLDYFKRKKSDYLAIELERENEEMKQLRLESAGEMFAVTSKNAELERKLARTEIELEQARAEIERLGLKIKHDDSYITGLKQEIINNTEESEFHAKNAERHWNEKLAEKDALINHLAEALRASRKYPNTLLLTGSGNDFLLKELAMIDAAIEAAKGGK